MGMFDSIGNFWNRNFSGGWSDPQPQQLGNQLQNILQLLAAGGNPSPARDLNDPYKRPPITSFDPSNFPGVPGGSQAVNAMGLSTGLDQSQINEGGVPLSNLSAAAPKMDPQMQNVLYQMLIQQLGKRF